MSGIGRREFMAIAITLLVALPAPGRAQGATVTVRVHLPVTEPVGVLDLSSAVTRFAPASNDDLDRGRVLARGPLVTASANHSFVVLVSRPGSASGAPGPVSGLRMTAGDGAPSPILGSRRALFSSPFGGTVVRRLDFDWMLDFTTATPGEYREELEISLELR